MALVRWDPVRELSGLQTDMNRLFDTFFQPEGNGQAAGARRWVPAMDLVETEDSLLLRADLPGLSEEDVSVEVQDNVLTVSGERRAEHEDKGEGYHRVERSFGQFTRTVSLPDGIDQDQVQANFNNGVLEVRIPKPEQRQPKKIAIGGGKGTIEAGDAQ